MTNPTLIDQARLREAQQEFEAALAAMPFGSERIANGQQFNAYESASNEENDDPDDWRFYLSLGPITDFRHVLDIESEWRAKLVEAALRVAMRSRQALTETAASPGSGDGWRCFFCDEHFTDEALARDHFGFLGWEPGCVNKLVQSDQSRRAELVRTEIAFRKAIAERNEAREALAKLEALTPPSKEGDE